MANNPKINKIIPWILFTLVHFHIYIYISKPKPCYIVWNEQLLAQASMSMHTRRNIWALIKQATFPHSSSLKLVDKFTYQGSGVSSTEKDVNTRLAKAWTAIDRLLVIWNKMKRSFFQAAVVSILLYGCTAWTLTKRMEKKLNGNYTRMLRAILNKSWRQHPKSSSCVATYHLSRKLYKVDELDMRDTAGEVGMKS